MREHGDEDGAEVERREYDEGPYHCEAPYIADKVESESLLGRGIEKSVDVEGREWRSGVVCGRNQPARHLRDRVG